MKIVVLDGYALNPGDLSWNALDCFGSVTVYDRTPSHQAAERIGDAEIVLTNKTPITAELLDACPSVRLVCVLATGYNVVDCAAAKERNIPVCNVPFVVWNVNRIVLQNHVPVSSARVPE